MSALTLAFSKVTFMQYFSLYDLYYQWEASGIFDFLLPMLLIFAVIFGILTTSGVLGNNRGVSVITSLVIALMAMRLGVVQDFFSVIFPGLGIGIAVLISILILAGLFMQDANWRAWMPTFFYGGIVVGLIIVIVTFNNFAWFGSSWWQQNWVNIVWIAALLAILGPILFPKDPKDKQYENNLFQTPFGPIWGGTRQNLGPDGKIRS